jgi:Protein of unknown function (DUF3048) N-terminal domain/Protein of unknown function (DUF3048) C-terminal domain
VSWYRRKSVLAVLGVLTAGVLVLAGFLVFRGRAAPSVPGPTISPQAGGQLLSPFTGEPVRSLGPVLAVKIDNIVNARPQTGLSKADIVYVMPVEGGLTRFLAIYSSRFPPVLGPVRSARDDDLQVLRQFGRPAFAYSGAQPHLLPVVEHARIVDLYDGLVGGYYRDNSRVAPYNLYAHTSQLLAEARGASTAHDIGFRFGPAPAGGTPTTARSVSYPAASFTFRWSQAAGRWLVWMDGSPAMSTDAGQLGAPTVVIQYTRVGTSRFPEWGGPAPYAYSTGAGQAVVLRNGQAWNAHWSRPHGSDGTTYTTDSGQRMTFARGPVWVLLVSQSGTSG